MTAGHIEVIYASTGLNGQLQKVQTIM